MEGDSLLDLNGTSKSQVDNMKNVDTQTAALFDLLQERFTEWLVDRKPTGEFQIKIPVSQGGLRGKPKIIKTQDI